MKEIKNLTLIIIFLTGLGFSNTFAQEAPTLYAVMFYADNCSATKSLAPKINDLQSRLEGEKVKFVEFDLSNKESIEKTQALANKYGLNKVLASNQGTGFVVLVDANNKEKKAILTTKQSLDEMLAIVLNNL